MLNLAFAWVIFLWQIVNTFYGQTDLIRREPGSLGLRKWSMYGRLYLRHFNELDHELQARLSRAYRPASRYVKMLNTRGRCGGLRSAVG